MHGEEQREGGAHRFFATATQTAVLNFTTKQLSDDRLAGGAQRTATPTQIKQLHLGTTLETTFSAFTSKLNKTGNMSSKTAGQQHHNMRVPHGGERATNHRGVSQSLRGRTSYCQGTSLPQSLM